MNAAIDTRTITRDRVPYRIDIDPDPITVPQDYDCYSHTDVRGFNANRWRFVVITVRIDLDNVDIHDSLSGLEYGDLGTRWIDTAQLIEDHPVPDLIHSCRQPLTDLNRRLHQVLRRPRPTA